MSRNVIKSSIDVLSQDWVKKFHFENKMDINLQTATENESSKLEISDIPTISKLDFASSDSTTTEANNSNDSYLQSILSSPKPATNTSSSSNCTGTQACACYKCQRQRRRAGANRNNITATAPLTKQSESQPTEPFESSPFLPTSITITEDIKADATSAEAVKSVMSFQQQSADLQSTSSLSKRADTLRKTPTLKSYEKHLPKPTYSQHDSIYRVEKEKLQIEGRINNANNMPVNRRSNSLNDLSVYGYNRQQQEDNYKVSWKEDETGDDILTSLVTFQTIFEEKPDNEGLSEVLEQRAKELKYKKLKEQQEVSKRRTMEPVLPPRLAGCLTLSYRDGPKHNPLTLYHTMKIPGTKERLIAYDVAFKHCTHANSGMRAWIKRKRVQPVRDNIKLAQPARRSTTKRSLLLLNKPRINKNHKSDEAPGTSSGMLGGLLWSSHSSEKFNHLHDNNHTAVITPKRSIDMISAPIPLNNPTTSGEIQPIDVMSVAHALLPNNGNNDNSKNHGSSGSKVPYEHIDAPAKPRQQQQQQQGSANIVVASPEFKDTSSISSSESAGITTPSSASFGSSKLLRTRPSRLFSSLGRKASMRSPTSHSSKASSIQSASEKSENGMKE